MFLFINFFEDAVATDLLKRTGGSRYCLCWFFRTEKAWTVLTLSSLIQLLNVKTSNKHQCCQHSTGHISETYEKFIFPWHFPRLGATECREHILTFKQILLDILFV